ncbi:hypothetical protein ACFHW1_12605 [Micromonospora sp. LOL_014]|uniref:hypothetical protein n=1 Tax=Micromonospora sp. LOL_014 TaxID=3345415 RepID=UPI003A896DDE
MLRGARNPSSITGTSSGTWLLVPRCHLMTTPAAAARGSVADGASDKFLRLALKLDAVVTGMNGLAYLVAASMLGDLFDLSTGFLRGGVFLLVFGVVVWLVGGRSTISASAAATVVDVNVIWVSASLVVAAAGIGDPSTIARVWIVMQAAVVGLFALLQVIGLRRQS